MKTSLGQHSCLSAQRNIVVRHTPLYYAVVGASCVVGVLKLLFGREGHVPVKRESEVSHGSEGRSVMRHLLEPIQQLKLVAVRQVDVLRGVSVSVCEGGGEVSQRVRSGGCTLLRSYQ